MKIEKFISNSDDETKQIAKNIAAVLQSGDILLLSGDLGVGKTVFAKGIGEYFGITKEITSPTFAIMNLYDRDPDLHPRGTCRYARAHRDDNIKSLIHIDTYRLKDEQEIIDIGALDYIGQPDTITVIEWPEKIENLIQNKKRIVVKITHDSDSKRLIEVKI